jgi:hypothetical protein
LHGVDGCRQVRAILFEPVELPLLVGIDARDALLKRIADRKRDGATLAARLRHHRHREEGDHRQEQVQTQRRHVTRTSPGEVFGAEEAGLGEQRRDGAQDAGVDVEHAVEQVAEQVAERAHQPLHRLPAGVAVVAEQRRAAVAAGGLRRGIRGGFRVRRGVGVSGGRVHRHRSLGR